MNLMRSIRGGRESISVKLVTIGLLLAIFVPILAMVQGLIAERADRQKDVVIEVSEKWGASQTITGPVLSVPYRDRFDNPEMAYFLPEKLVIDGNVDSQTRRRGIFDVPLYESDLKFSGHFVHPNFGQLGIAADKVMWDQATVAVDIPDMRGITKQIVLNWDSQERTLGSGSSGIFDSVDAAVGISPENPHSYNFSFDLNLRGSSELDFMPLGKETTVNLTSDWTNPSFDGAFLPLEHTIDATGFKANWNVLDLNRSIPSQWTSENNVSLNTELHKFGVKLFLPVDVYQKTMRSVKYAIAVVALVFTVMFLVEVIAKRRVHPLQYLLIGFALVIFYTLLLSLSEHIRFAYAYLAASVAITLMVTLFAKSVMKSKALALTNGAVIALLYVFIYVLMQLQDFALLMGSVALFVILAAVMFVTRKIDWYAKETA